MTSFIIKRLMLLPLLLFIFSVFVFFIIQAPPGDFVTTYIAELAASGSSVDQAQIDALRELYGLDQPIYLQYVKWMGRMLRGDLGVSLDWKKPIGELIRRATDVDGLPRRAHLRRHLDAGYSDRHHRRDPSNIPGSTTSSRSLTISASQPLLL